jgi:phosphodiesterase/alkaline phosphatase D-like protein
MTTRSSPARKWISTGAILSSFALPVLADPAFLGVSAGDANDTSAVLWTRHDPALQVAMDALVSTSPEMSSGVFFPASADPNADYAVKVLATGLTANTRYYYQFVDVSGNVSLVGTFKTAPMPDMSVAVHFAFSGDMDGLMRPYALSSQVPAEGLDFYLNCGDVIYETASAVAGNNGASYLNSPSVTLSGSSASLNGEPVGGTTFATQLQLFNDYSKKYREQFLPVNTGGQNCLQSFYAGQGNFTLYDNHELGNRQYINGGAPAGGSVGGPSGNDMPTGRGVDARANGSGNPGNLNDTNSSASDYMNRSTGFQTLQQVYLNYQPVRENRSTATVLPGDNRTGTTKQLFFAQPWGRNAIYIHTDDRSYRDIRIKTATGSADDTGARADNPNRTYLGATQLAWLEQTLLDAEQAGTPWKFVAFSDPVDQIGPIGSSLPGVTMVTMQPYSGNVSYGPVNADGGKAFIGGYRAERNALMKFIADNHIVNVVFLSTDDHQNRINEVLYSTTGVTGSQSDYVKVPHCFSIVCGPLGATGPDLFLNHDFASVQGAANLIANAQITAGVEPIGLMGYVGLHDVKRDQNGTLVNETTPQAADFYSPDTFNYNILDVSANGTTLTVTSKGITSTAMNAAAEYGASGNTVRTIFSFSVTAASAPQITCPQNKTVGTDADKCGAVVNFAATASGFPDPVLSYSIDGTEITSPYTFPKGTSTVTCVASNDVAVDTCTFTVTVNDDKAPVAGVSQTIVAGDVISTLLATDNCDGTSLSIYVKDSAQGQCGGTFAAGPYAPGTKVKLLRTPVRPSISKGSDGTAATIRTVGNPVLVVTDSSGNRSCTVIPVGN